MLTHVYVLAHPRRNTSAIISVQGVLISRRQLAFNVDDLDTAVAFCSTVFATTCTNTKSDYANFAVTEPPLKLVLIENPGHNGSLNYVGIEMTD